MENIIATEKYEICIDNIISLFEQHYIFLNNKEIEFYKELKTLKRNVGQYQNEEEIINEINNIIKDLEDDHTHLIVTQHTKGYFPINIYWVNNDLYIQIDKSNKYVIKKINGYKIEQLINIYVKGKVASTESMIRLELVKDIIFGQKKFNTNNLDIEYSCENKDVNICIEYQNIESFKNNNINKIKNNIKFYHIKQISDKIVYLRIYTFNKKNISINILNSLRKRSLENVNLVIDLRNNSGGYVNEAKELLSYFIKDKKEYPYEIIRKHSNSKIVEKQCVLGKKLFKNTKVWIVINQFTMSSSEYILAYGFKLFMADVKIIGQKSAGILDQATVYNLTTNINLQLTTARYIGIEENYKKGIKPDIYIENIDNKDIYEVLKQLI